MIASRSQTSLSSSRPTGHSREKKRSKAAGAGPSVRSDNSDLLPSNSSSPHPRSPDVATATSNLREVVAVEDGASCQEAEHYVLAVLRGFARALVALSMRRLPAVAEAIASLPLEQSRSSRAASILAHAHFDAMQYAEVCRVSLLVPQLDHELTRPHLRRQRTLLRKCAEVLLTVSRVWPSTPRRSGTFVRPLRFRSSLRNSSPSRQITPRHGSHVETCIPTSRITPMPCGASVELRKSTKTAYTPTRSAATRASSLRSGSVLLASSARRSVAIHDITTPGQSSCLSSLRLPCARAAS